MKKAERSTALYCDTLGHENGLAGMPSCGWDMKSSGDVLFSTAAYNFFYVGGNGHGIHMPSVPDDQALVFSVIAAHNSKMFVPVVDGDFMLPIRLIRSSDICEGYFHTLGAGFAEIDEDFVAVVADIEHRALGEQDHAGDCGTIWTSGMNGLIHKLPPLSSGGLFYF